jgi:hypothetical protein
MTGRFWVLDLTTGGLAGLSLAWPGFQPDLSPGLAWP